MPAPSPDTPNVIRPAEADEIDGALAVSYTAFSEQPVPEQLEDDKTIAEVDRLLVAVDDGAIVGTGMAYSFAITVPGAAQVPAAGVSWIGVLPTHRRRGILRSLIARQFDDIVARGEPLAVLLASEAPIYGRFGYGAATRYIKVEVESRRSAFVRAPVVDGRIRLVAPEEAAKVLPAVFDRYRLVRTGEVDRNDAYWSVFFRDADHQRGGASSWFFALHETAGKVGGYAAYRVKDTWTDDSPSHTMSAAEVVATDPEVEAALWRFLFDIDLVSSVRMRSRPSDDPLRWRFVDQRCYRTTHVSDWLWVRVLDVEAALSARRYNVEDSLVFELRDQFRPGNSGCYRLDGGTDGATCMRLANSPGADAIDLELDVVELGSIYLGGVAPSTLAEAGRIVERRPGALPRADTLFTAHPEPICSMPF